nr:hypothetical protein [Mycoplasmopsis bovis]QQH18755.1 hypothetical protein HYE49_00940 [Mycoplasmopsis bovis]
MLKKMKYQAVAIGNHLFDYVLEHMFNIERTNCLKCHFYHLILSEMTKHLLKNLKAKDGKLAVKNEQVFNSKYK